MRLSSGNIKDMKVRIEETALVQTFKDAFFITRALGFQYLWIDSLCIIQDDEDDWLKESSKMSGVYGRSSLNLSASSATDGTFGCFRERTPHVFDRIQRYEIKIPGDTRSYVCLDPSLYEQSVQNSPLSKRGWAFQERFLSPRTIHFTDTQLYWECKEKIACETFQSRLPHSARHGLIERSSFLTMWPSIVQNYSKRELTRATDKLVAISGVARWLHARSGDQYLAGLWMKDCEVQLLWELYLRNAKRPPPRIPSWSWAAYDGAVHIDHRVSKGARLLCGVAEVKITATGDDIYGLIQSAELALQISGPLLGAKVSFNTWDNFSQWWKVTYMNGKKGTFQVAADRGPGQSDRLWYCLPILGTSTPFRVTFRGLMIEPIPSSGGRFRRVGTFLADDKTKSTFPNAEYCSFKDARKDPDCWADEIIYKRPGFEGVNGGKDYLVILVWRRSSSKIFVYLDPLQDRNACWREEASSC